MTQYFLIGGYPKKGNNAGRDFCEAFLSNLPENSLVLICSFAREESEWENSYQEMSQFFTLHLPHKKLRFENTNVENFSEQISRARAIFFRGGDDAKLFKCLRKAGEWQQSLENKNVAGTSAGADVLSQYYYDITDGTIKEGLGLAKVKVIPHFESTEYNVDWQQAQAKLENFHPELSTWCLREGEFNKIQAS